MNLLALVKELWRESGTGGKEPVTVIGQSGESERLVQWIRQADLEIQQRHSDWNYLWAQGTMDTVASQHVYSAPVSASIFDERSFIVDGEAPLDVVPYLEVRGQVRPSGTGQPSRVVLLPNGSFRFDPTPDAVYTITFDYWSVPTRMVVADTSESVIPAEFRQAIVGKALMHYAEYENAPEIMQKGQRMYADWFPALEAKELPGDREMHRQAEGNYLVVTVE